MQRAAKRTPHVNTTVVQDVKVNRISSESTRHGNVTHLVPQEMHHHEDKIFHKEEYKRKNIRHKKHGVKLNKLLEFAQGDEFIILALIAILIMEGNQDIILFLALGYILVADKLPPLTALLK